MHDPCQQALLPRSGPHPKQIVLAGLLQTSPSLCSSKIIHKETGKEVGLEKRRQSQSKRPDDDFYYAFVCISQTQSRTRVQDQLQVGQTTALCTLLLGEA